MTLAAVHQFEIRYSNILTFSQFGKDIISPFVQLASSVEVANENSFREKITLTFEGDYQIIISWDRIILRKEGEISNLSHNNSIVEEPFYNILSKLKGLSGFGQVRNILYYSFWVRPNTEQNKSEILNDFNSKYLTQTSLNIEPNLTDTAIHLESIGDPRQTFITIGPYFGPNDLAKHQIEINNVEFKKKLDCIGEALVFKCFEMTKVASFSEYKNLAKLEQEYIEKIWVS